MRQFGWSNGSMFAGCYTYPNFGGRFASAMLPSFVCRVVLPLWAVISFGFVWYMCTLLQCFTVFALALVSFFVTYTLFLVFVLGLSNHAKLSFTPWWRSQLSVVKLYD